MQATTNETQGNEKPVWLQSEEAFEAEGFEAGRREVENDELIPNPYPAGDWRAQCWSRGVLRAFEELP